MKEEAFEETLSLMRATAKRPFDALPALGGTPGSGLSLQGCAGDENRAPVTPGSCIERVDDEPMERR